ncbi:MAG: hypothetical protein GQ527_01130, partial [Bacteroidales bacterium]|nr:hypothetical protein [Bacteroidales bacterium]
MRLLIKAVLILVFCIPVITQAKNNLEKRKTEFFLQIDSLKLNPDQLKLDYKSRNYYQDSVSIYYQEILEMYKHIHSSLNHSQQIYWLYEIGLLERCLGHMDQAILSHQSIGQLIDKNEDERSYFFNNIQLADVYRQSGRKKESNDVFLLLLELPMIQKDTSQQMDINSMVSENYENLGEHAKALELALQLYNYHLKESEYAAASYNLIQMGRISSVIESDTSYLEYYHMANDLALRSGDIGRIINNLINTGIIYRNNSYPLIGLKYLKKAENYKDPEFDHANTYLFHALSRTYNALDSFALGYVYSLKELKEAEAYDDYPSMFYAQLRLLDHYVRNDEVEQARNALREAVRLNKVIDNKSLYPSLYKQLSDMSLRMKDYPKAMAYLDSSYLAQDKFLSKTNNDKLVDLREKSDYYIHRNRISELVTKNKLEQEKSARLKITIFAFLFVLALTVYFTIVIRKRLHELKESYVNLV